MFLRFPQRIPNNRQNHFPRHICQRPFKKNARESYVFCLHCHKRYHASYNVGTKLTFYFQNKPANEWRNPEMKSRSVFVFKPLILYLNFEAQHYLCFKLPNSLFSHLVQFQIHSVQDVETY